MIINTAVTSEAAFCLSAEMIVLSMNYSHSDSSDHSMYGEVISAVRKHNSEETHSHTHTINLHSVPRIFITHGTWTAVPELTITHKKDICHLSSLFDSTHTHTVLISDPCTSASLGAPGSDAYPKTPFCASLQNHIIRPLNQLLLLPIALKGQVEFITTEMWLNPATNKTAIKLSERKKKLIPPAPLHLKMSVCDIWQISHSNMMNNVKILLNNVDLIEKEEHKLLNLHHLFFHHQQRPFKRFCYS